MKRILLIAAIAVLSVVGANAQSLGVKGGYNYATLKGETAEKFNLKGLSGFYVGAVVEFPLSDIFVIQPEVVYSRQGAKAESDFPVIGKKEATLTMNYLNIPVFAKIKFGEAFSLQGGPQFGFLMGKPEVTSNLFGGDSTEIDKKLFGTFDFGIGVGASFKLESGLFLDARYTHGLTNVLDKDNNSLKNANIGDNNDFKNSVFSVGLGFMF